MIARRVIRLMFVALLPLVLAAATALAALVTTERGARWIVGVVQARSDGLLSFADVRGTLAGGLQIGRLTVQTEASRTTIDELRLTVNPATLPAGQLRLSTAQALRLRVELLRPPDPERPFVMPRLSVPVQLRFVALSVDSLEVARQGQLLWTGTALRVDGDWRDTQVRLRAAGATIAGVELAVAGSLRLEPGLPLAAELRWQWPALGASGSGPVRGDLDELRFEQQLNVPEPVAVRGTLARAIDAPHLEASATWDRVVRTVNGLGELDIAAGNATASGWIDDWRAIAAARLSAPGWPAMQASATAAGDRSEARFGKLSLVGRAGEVDGTGRWSFAGAPRFALALHASRLDPGLLRAGLKGSIGGEFDVRADPDGHTVITLHRVDGTLMDRPVRGEGVLDWREGTLAFQGLSLRAGRNRLSADGSWGERLSGRFALDAPEPRLLWPGLTGQFDATAELGGTRQAPIVKLRAEGRDLTLDGYALERLRLDLDVDGAQRAVGKLRASGVRAHDVALGEISGDVSGTLARHDLALRLAGGEIDASLAAAGNWNGRRLGLQVGAATVSESHIGAWQLAGEPVATLATSQVTLSAHCWQQATAQLCLDATDWKPGVLSAAGRLTRFNLAALDRWLPAGLALAGEADGSAVLRTGSAGLTGTLELALSDAQIRYDTGDEVLTAPLRTAIGRVAIDAAGAELRLALAGDAGLALALDGHMAAPVGMQGGLDLRVTGALPDLAPFLPFVAGGLGLAEITGGLALDASVAGTLEAPQFTGVARFTRGSFVLPAWGVQVEAIDVSLLGDGSSTLQLRGSARAGGMLTFSGEANPLAEGGPTATFRVAGNRVRAVNLPDLRLVASPDITIRYGDGRFVASGQVSVPAADIVVRELPATAISPSADVVVHGRERLAVASAAPALGGEVQLELGRDVHLKGFGLDTRIEGQLRVAATASEELRGYGTLRLKDGKFGAYGRELTIDRGTLGFNGPLDDPTLNVRASRRIEWEGRLVKAGIDIRGTAARPESRVYSDPAMAEADALSYLIAGQPLQRASASDRSMVAGAALALGAQQAAPFTQRIGGAVSLDELSVAGSSLEDSALVAGKQLGSNLYLRFSYGLFNRIGTVLARYRIGRRLSVEAASGEDQSLDLVYSVERD